MSFWAKIAGQFGRPSGILGRLAGIIMASRSSNIERNTWAVSLLELKPTDRVLEIGFGPGIAIQKMSEIVTGGIVWGIDHSTVMLDQASKRNRAAISQGRVKLLFSSVSDPLVFDSPIDSILDINSFQFWDNAVESLQKLRAALREGGRIVLVHQPRKPGSTEKDADDAGERLKRYLGQAGFQNIATKKLALKPVPVIAVIGSK